MKPTSTSPPAAEFLPLIPEPAPEVVVAPVREAPPLTQLEERDRPSALWLLLPLLFTVLVSGGLWVWWSTRPTPLPLRFVRTPEVVQRVALPTPAPVMVAPLPADAPTRTPSSVVKRPTPFAEETPALMSSGPQGKHAVARPVERNGTVLPRLTVARPPVDQDGVPQLAKLWTPAAQDRVPQLAVARSPANQNGVPRLEERRPPTGTVPPLAVAQAPANRRPAVLAPPTVRATFSLEGGGDLDAIDVTLYSSSPVWQRELHPSADGTLSIEVPTRGGYYLLAKAPGHAFATHSYDFERAPEEEVPLIALELLKQYDLDVADLGATDLDEPTSQRVEAGQIWKDLEFSQKNGVLHLMGKKCVCILYRLGEVPAAGLAGVGIPEGEPSRCFVAMEVGEAFLVRPDPEARWVVLRLHQPGRSPSAPARMVIRPR